MRQSGCMRAKPKVRRDKTKGLWVVGGLYVNGRRKRQYFRTKDEAELYLARIKAQIESEGQAAWSISAAERLNAASALIILRPLGANLVDAANYYAAHLRATSRSLTFSVLLAKLLTARQGDGVSASHLSDLKYRLNRFASTFGHRLVAEISFGEIDDWLRSLEGSLQGRMNYRKVLHGAFAFAQAHEYCEFNPVTKTARPKIKRGPPAVLTPMQMRTLMAAAPKEIVPYLAVAGFAGLRNSEVEKLDWSNVDLKRKRIEVRAVHKTGHRWVDIEPNLLAWLEPYMRSSGPVTPKLAIRIRKRVAKMTKIPWASNCLRHSYGSAHAVLHGDLVKTSSQMGNTPRVLLEHYRQLITPEQAADWFSIMRSDDQSNVIELGTVAV